MCCGVAWRGDVSASTVGEVAGGALVRRTSRGVLLRRGVWCSVQDWVSAAARVVSVQHHVVCGVVVRVTAWLACGDMVSACGGGSAVSRLHATRASTRRVAAAYWCVVLLGAVCVPTHCSATRLGQVVAVLWCRCDTIARTVAQRSIPWRPH